MVPSCESATSGGFPLGNPTNKATVLEWSPSKPGHSNTTAQESVANYTGVQQTGWIVLLSKHIPPMIHDSRTHLIPVKLRGGAVPKSAPTQPDIVDKVMVQWS